MFILKDRKIAVGDTDCPNAADSLSLLCYALLLGIK